MIGKIFQKQAIMRRVVFALLILLAFSTYLFGWRVLGINAIVLALGILTEFIFEKVRGKKVSEAVLVTCLLYGLSLPPGVPIWVAAIGIVFAVAVGKEVFGGFGRNIFNPAITGRLFVYISFPTIMQRSWVEPRIPGFFSNIFGSNTITDALSGATPLGILRTTGGESISFWHQFFGFRLGSIGETAIWLIIAAAVYLIVTKTAQWRLIASTFLSAVLLSVIFYLTNISTMVPHLAMVSGSLLYVCVFMATDPVSAPNKPASQWLYGLIIGGTTILIRTFSGFPEGTSFGVLLGNTFASLIDEIMPAKKKKPPKAAAKPVPSEEKS